MSDFSRRLDELLILNHKKRADLIRGTGLAESTVRQWFTKDVIPSATYAYKVACFFGVSVEYLVTGEDLKEPGLYLSSEEIELIDIYRSFSVEDKKRLLALAHTLENVK